MNRSGHKKDLGTFLLHGCTVLGGLNLELEEGRRVRDGNDMDGSDGHYVGLGVAGPGATAQISGISCSWLLAHSMSRYQLWVCTYIGR